MFFLNAISLNPKARHLWSYLESVLITLNQKENIIKMKDFAIENFEDQHNVHNIKDLP